MTVVPARFGSVAPSTTSLAGLDRVNFFIAAMQAGFGLYVAVYLAEQKWTQADIGFLLTAGSLAGLLSQLPGGELVDSVRSKRSLVALGAVIVAVSAIIVDFGSTLPVFQPGLSCRELPEDSLDRRSPQLALA